MAIQPPAPAPPPPAGRRDQPLHDFSQSHAGILLRLEQLRALPGRLAQPGAESRAARETAAELLRFFRDAVFEHHAEEEEALFPAVARSAARGDEAALVAALASRLTSEHREIEADWKAIEPALTRIARGKPAALDGGIVSRLCDTYAAHAQFEERAYLPLAASILGENDQAALALTLHVRHALDVVVGPF